MSLQCQEPCAWECHSIREIVSLYARMYGRVCVCVCVFLSFYLRKGKKDKKEYLGEYCEKLKTSLIKEALKRHSTF